MVMAKVIAIHKSISISNHMAVISSLALKEKQEINT